MIEKPRTRDGLLNRFKDNTTGDIGPLDFRELIRSRLGIYACFFPTQDAGDDVWSVTTGATHEEQGHNQVQPLFQSACYAVRNEVDTQVDDQNNRLFRITHTGVYAVSMGVWFKASAHPTATGEVRASYRINAGSPVRFARLPYYIVGYGLVYNDPIAWRGLLRLTRGDTLGFEFYSLVSGATVGGSPPYLATRGNHATIVRVA